jgi:phenylalanine-4-hydroxylase
VRVIRTRYRIDDYQKSYFVIDSFERLFVATQPDFSPYYAALEGVSEIEPGVVIESDRLA